MDEHRRKKRLTKFGRAARAKRILGRLREGWTYDEVAREEAVAGPRVRRIVAQHLKDREAVEGVTHAHIQIDRLGSAMRVAAEKMAEGDIRAIGPFIRAIDRLDRYQDLARRPRRRPTREEDLAIVRSLVARFQGAPGSGPSAQAPGAGRDAVETEAPPSPKAGAAPAASGWMAFLASERP